MTWIFLAVISHFFWAIVNVGEKYLVSNRFKNPFLYLLLAFWVGPLVLLLTPFINFYIPDLFIICWIALSGICYFIGCVFYIKAMQIEEVSRINIWWNLVAVFNLIIAWSMIGETLNTKEIVAFVVLFIAALIASVHFQQVKFKISKALVLMLFACLFISFCDVIIKYVSQFVPFSLTFVYLSLTFTTVSFSFFLSRQFRNDFKTESKNFGWGLVLLIIAITILSKIGLIFNIWALSLGPVALVASLEGTQVIFVFILAGFLTVFMPRIIREDFDKKNLFLKLAALVLMIGGLVVLNLG